MRQAPSEFDYQGEPTVEAYDLLVPNIGELIGGSIREERLDILQATMDKLGLTQQLDWYLDTRRFRSVPHGGFGLGFERMIMLATGTESIRDVIPYPRYLGHCKT
jgi:asparaginyl-tRNA synthetase